MSSRAENHPLWSPSECERLQKLKRKREATEPYNTSEGRKRARDLAIEQANMRIADLAREGNPKGKGRESGLNRKPIPRGLDIDSGSSSEFRSDAEIGSAHSLPPPTSPAHINGDGEGPSALTVRSLTREEERRRMARKAIPSRALRRAASPAVDDGAEIAKIVAASTRERDKLAKHNGEANAEHIEWQVKSSNLEDYRPHSKATVNGEKKEKTKKKKTKKGRSRTRSKEGQINESNVTPLDKQLAKPDLTRPAAMLHGAWNQKNGYHKYRLGNSRDLAVEIQPHEAERAPPQHQQKSSKRVQEKSRKNAAAAEREQAGAPARRVPDSGKDDARKETRRKRRQAKKQARKANRASAPKVGGLNGLEAHVAVTAAA